jgi:hypothetical protein
MVGCLQRRCGEGDRESREYLIPPWQLFDARAITAQALAQRLNLTWNPLHFIPIVYEELNAVLLNTLCKESNEFSEPLAGSTDEAH